MEQVTYYEYEWHEMEKLIIDSLRNGVDGDVTHAQEFSIVALEEWNNDSDHAFDVSQKYVDNPVFFGDDDKQEVENFIATGKWHEFTPSLVNILYYMVWKQIIPAGHYLITVSW